MTTQLAPRRADTDQAERDRFAHIVHPAWKAVEAMMNGTPVTALCGLTWVPKRNPRNYPKCPTCVEKCRASGWAVP
jgi:hypothetical protein